MSKLELTLKRENPALIKKANKIIGKVPVEAQNIKPSLLKDLNISEIGEIELLSGKESYLLKDFFEIEGSPSEEIIINGDLSNFKYLGAAMETGSITVNGNLGMHAASEMKAGYLEVNGNVGDWLGAEMTGGFIKINGHAGNYVGAAFRGDTLGMNRGVIYIKGNAGNFVANKMRRGEIIIEGDCGELLAAQMIAGSVYVFGSCKNRVGAGMKRGTIITLNEVEMLPTFNYNISYFPDFLNIAYNHLKKDYGIEVPPQAYKRRYKRYTGDNTELGKGEILIWENV
ncbi:formylmethanofuran dehydrogenase subunit C [Halanaerobium sp. Z-7514]|uniref:Formylmethanofuran dehydrogenase subunit C n=1 Tax=Halanaerobium polyolivorans TaxID=2886943 RepID=A0AAW4WXI4_9FIRM|nr:formylmethanofuran dehydrogenase subunit C [Halanaerobium polyolivorans]RQD73316.1 MAG: formylmethanofuran dehydrogenase subunit C [Halanaerobium sp. MSAO_Bac5]